MREYETVFILHPSLEEAQVEEEIEGVRQTIQAGAGEIVQIDRWGRRKLAYGIRKANEGIYTLIRFRSAPGVLNDLERRYRLREDVLRHLTLVAQGPTITLETPVHREAGEPAAARGSAETTEGSPPATTEPSAPKDREDATVASGETPQVSAEPGADPN